MDFRVLVFKLSYDWSRAKGTVCCVTAYLMPSDTTGVFPWELGDVDRGSLITVANWYGLPHAKTASNAVRAAAAHRGPGGALVCLHNAGADPVPVIARGRVDRCSQCEKHMYEYDGSFEYDELDAATALAHWTAWLETAGSPAAATMVASVIMNLPGSAATRSKAARRRIASTLEHAHQLLKVTPPRFDAKQWALAAPSIMHLEDASVWANAITAGATISQADTCTGITLPSARKRNARNAI